MFTRPGFKIVALFESTNHNTRLNNWLSILVSWLHKSNNANQRFRTLNPSILFKLTFSPLVNRHHYCFFLGFAKKCKWTQYKQRRWPFLHAIIIRFVFYDAPKVNHHQAKSVNFQCDLHCYNISKFKMHCYNISSLKFAFIFLLRPIQKPGLGPSKSQVQNPDSLFFSLFALTVNVRE